MTEDIIESGIIGLDKILGGGFEHGSLILIAGTAGVGKSTLVLQILHNAAKKGAKALYIPITSNTNKDFAHFASHYSFYNEHVIIHPIDRSTAEKDPLSVLIDIGNIIASSEADIVAIDPITPLGIGFPSHEQRRFIYTFDSMTTDWDCLVLVTGELLHSELHNAPITHVVDGIIQLSSKINEFADVRHLEVLKLPGSSNQRIAGRHQYSINSDGVRVFPRLETSNDFGSIDVVHRASTGITSLDDMIMGGIPGKSSILLSGCSGTGKTTIGLQFIHNGLKGGEAGVIVSFDDTPTQLLQKAHYLGLDLDEYIKNGMLKIINVLPIDTCPPEHSILISQAVEEIGAKRLLFDGIGDLEAAISETVQLREHIRLLTRYLKHAGVTSIFTIELPMLYGNATIADSKIAFVMDGWIQLSHNKKNSRIDKTITILKLSASDYDSTVREFDISDRGIRIIP